MIKRELAINKGGMVVGLVLVLAGVLLALDRLDILQFNNILRFWPIIFVALGLAQIIQPAGSSRSSGVWLIGLGAFFLSTLSLGWVRVRNLWPLFLIAAGIWVIWRTSQVQAATLPPSEGAPVPMSNALLNGTALFGGANLNSNSPEFKGGSLTAILGALEVDLRKASIPPGQTAVLDTFAWWGGIDIKVPEDWTVIVQGMPIMGAFEDSTRQPSSGAGPKLLVKGTVIMGGLEIKND